MLQHTTAALDAHALASARTRQHKGESKKRAKNADAPEVCGQRVVVVVAQGPLQRPSHNPQAADDAEALYAVVVGGASDAVVVHHGQRRKRLRKGDADAGAVARDEEEKKSLKKKRA